MKVRTYDLVESVLYGPHSFVIVWCSGAPIKSKNWPSKLTVSNWVILYLKSDRTVRQIHLRICRKIEPFLSYPISIYRTYQPYRLEPISLLPSRFTRKFFL